MQQESNWLSNCVSKTTLSSAELESGSAPGAFLPTPAPVLEDVRNFLILYWAGVWQSFIGRAQVLSVRALDQNRSPSVVPNLTVFVGQSRIAIAMITTKIDLVVNGNFFYTPQFVLAWPLEA